MAGEFPPNQFKEFYTGDILEHSMEYIIIETQGLSSSKRVRLLEFVEFSIQDKELIKNMSARVTLVRILVALLPDTLTLTERLLKKNVDKYSFELHFTIFCYLDWVYSLPEATYLASKLLMVIKDYLLCIRKTTAQAAWMAGHLLGDHWDRKSSLPVLLNLAYEAKYVAGRLGAIKGLKDILLSDYLEDNDKILQVLERISNVDPSRKVRNKARLILTSKSQILNL